MKQRNFKLNFYLLFTGIGLLISLVICFIIFFQFRGYIRTSYFDTLSRIAVMIEKQYPVLHDMEKLKQGAKYNQDWFWEISSDLSDISDSFGLAYIYYIERTGSGYVFRMSTNISRDTNIGLLGGPIWAEGTPLPEGVEDAWVRQRITMTSKPTVNEWGTLIAMRLPIVTNGETVGLLNMNYDISFVRALERRLLFILIISLLVATAITALLAVFGSHSVLIPVHEQEKAARETLEQSKEIERLALVLQDASVTKSEFLTNICTEMQSPINDVIDHSYSELSQKGLPEQQRKNMEIINESGNILSNIVGDILEINKIEAGHLKIVPVQYDLPSLIYEISAMYETPSANEPVMFKLDVDPNLPEKVIGDSHHIKQICLKLLNNAFAFTPKGTVLFRILCKPEKENILLFFNVRDTGSGISPDKIENIFTDYRHRAYTTSTRRWAGGTGLGLNIAKQISEMMKGKLTVASEIGKGTAFTLCVRQKLASKKTIGPETAKSLKTFQYHGNKV